MSSMEECPFCHADERIVKENDRAFVLLSNPRKMQGHFLVIPKKHIEKPWELTDEETEDIFELVFFLQRKIAENFATGCDVRQNYRPFLKQDRTKVDHIHYHVMPREFNDELYTKLEHKEGELFAELTEEEGESARRILE